MAMGRFLIAVLLGLGALEGMSPAFSQDGRAFQRISEEKRVALVIGNGAYGEVDALTNPANDARKMAAALGRLGFDPVFQGTDLDRDGMFAVLDQFAQRVEKGVDIATVFYAGHGVQIEGRNYLLPIDIRDDRDPRRDAIPADDVLAAMDGARQLRLLLLDACRNNPLTGRRFRGFGGRSVHTGRGLGGMSEAAVGQTLIGFATRADDIAEDGLGTNSPYTTALLAHLETPGLTLERLFGKVRDSVLDATDQRQHPFTYGSLGGEPIYLKLEVADPCAAAWLRVKNSSEATEVEGFLSSCGGSAQATEARVRLTQLQGGWGPPPDPDEMACRVLYTSDRPGDFETYVRMFPQGKCVRFAEFRLASLRPVPVTGADRYGDLAAGEEHRLAVLGNDRDADRVVWVETPGVGRAAVSRDGGSIEFTAPSSGPGSARFGYEVEGRGGRARGVVDVAWLAPPGPPRPAGLIEVVGVWPRVGNVFKDCSDCPEMVILPRGSFLMGSPDGEEGRDSDEGPQHRVTIDYDLAVGRYEVTFAEWDACVAGGGCDGYRPNDRGWGRGRRPVIYVSWNDIRGYLDWLSRKTGQRYRLLSEAEWEYAARAGTTTPFHTGRTITTDQANFDGNGTYGGSSKGVYRQQTVGVGSFSPNAFGLFDIHGNVWEWVEDCWNGNYNGAPTDGRAVTIGGCETRVLRGGSWYSDPGGVRSANRGRNSAAYRSSLSGFRLARTFPP